jgi:four helix bundle protein
VATIRSYRVLQVWQASMDLVGVSFDIVDAFPGKHRFICCNQLLSASISIPSNIAEGSRRPRKAYLNHLSYSLGSQAETETLLEVKRRRRLAPEPLVANGLSLAGTVGRMLHALVRSLEA